ncbi:uncharacterized protein LOC134213260 [Armigeres subalbatus]|uniref:uncharacterized protein LOC134213260 n=1 Tax=Armigeres subalbatus TaxID=124917 RepID=UPI002ED6256A
MNKISTIISIPTVHKVDQSKKILPQEFLLNNDVTILRNPPESANGLINWKVLTTFRTALKAGQIISAIWILVYLLSKSHSYQYEPFFTPLEVSYVFLTVNSVIGTVLLLGDSLLEARPVRRAFTSVQWFRVELWFTGLAAAGYYILGYCVLSDLFRVYPIGNNRSAATIGFIAALLFLVDWWMHFSKRRGIIRRLENEKDGDAEQENLA